MSSDNKHLYATGYNDAAIVHWDPQFTPMCGRGTYNGGSHCVSCDHERAYPGNGNIYGCGKYSGQGRTGSTCDGTGHTGTKKTSLCERCAMPLIETNTDTPYTTLL